MSDANPADPCILFAGGGTGGHLFPGIAVAQEIRRRHPALRIAFVGTTRGIEYTQVPRYGFDLHVLPVRPLRGRTFKETVQGALTLPQALGQAVALVRRLRPSVAVSVGGYAAGPATLAARLCGVPCAVMEQNAFAGVTNRLLARVAKHVLLSLPNRQLGRHHGARIVGNPVRADLLQLGAAPLAAMPARFDATRPLRILAFGGSQGAHALNEALMALAPALAGAQLPVELLHQTGVRDEARVREAYAAAGVAPPIARAVKFVDDMGAAMAHADLLLCRSGASTLAEAAVVGRASWLVPFPFAADDHQSANAQIFVDAGAAHCIRQTDLTSARLLDLLHDALASPATLSRMAQAARTLAKPDAVTQIADILLAER